MPCRSPRRAAKAEGLGWPPQTTRRSVPARYLYNPTKPRTSPTSSPRGPPRKPAPGASGPPAASPAGPWTKSRPRQHSPHRPHPPAFARSRQAPAAGASAPDTATPPAEIQGGPADSPCPPPPTSAQKPIYLPGYGDGGTQLVPKTFELLHKRIPNLQPYKY